MKLHLVSLGCARNLVDSEQMLGRLTEAGWSISPGPGDADVIVVNTCSFIQPAADESIDVILEMARFKREGSCRKLIVAGCLPERYGRDIAATLPEVDFFLGTGAFDKIVEAVRAAPAPPGASEPEPERCLLPHPETARVGRGGEKRVLSDSHAAYLKIAEGCDRRCTYCIIPRLRGGHRSRPLEAIASEADRLIRSGVKELSLVAQDSTAYGKDLSPPVSLARLLRRLSDLSDDIWIRILYGHPRSIDDRVIETAASRPNICSYFDIPIQHADDAVLKRMGRGYGRDDLYRLFDRIRTKAPDAALRTTAIVGFPGETDEAFEQLMRLAREIRFDHLGAFIYSDSEDLPSHGLPDHVPGPAAQERFDRLMTLQAGVSLARNRMHIGKRMPVLVEAAPEKDLYEGRSAFQAPEVDGLTYIHTRDRETPLAIGAFADVTVTDALEYDLVGEAV